MAMETYSSWMQLRWGVTSEEACEHSKNHLLRGDHCYRSILVGLGSGGEGTCV